jgi:hypothetical protein
MERDWLVGKKVTIGQIEARWGLWPNEATRSDYGRGQPDDDQQTANGNH